MRQTFGEPLVDRHRVSAAHAATETGRPAGGVDAVLKRTLDIAVASATLLLLLPVAVLLAVAIKVDSRGPLLFRCRRVGFRGSELNMLKLRKMRVGASGPALTVADDERFTRLGKFLASSKLDELPQLWNVVRGHMSLVGPRPEAPELVALRAGDYSV